MNGERSEAQFRVTLSWVFALLLGLFFLFNYLDRINELISVQAEIGELEQDVERMEQWNLQLQDELRYYASPEYVDEIARSELGYIQPGDEVFVVLSEDDQTSSLANLGQSATCGVAAPPEETGAFSFFDLDRWSALFR